METEEGETPAWVERWHSLGLQLLLFMLRRRFMTAAAYNEMVYHASAKQKSKVKITNAQWECRHPPWTRRYTGNQHGSFVHCRLCDLRLQYVEAEDREKAKEANNKKQAKARSKAQAKLRKNIETEIAEDLQNYNTDGKKPTKQEQQGPTEASSSSSSGVERALLLMAQTQQDQGAILSRQMESMATQQAHCTQVMSQAMSAVQTSINQLTNTVQTSQPDVRMRRRKTTKKEPAEEAESFVICSSAAEAVESDASDKTIP